VDEQAAPPRTEWKAHWTLVLSAMAGMSFYTVITYSLGTFIEPIEREFGWDRAAISLGLTIFAFISMLGGPFIGLAIDRWGTRRIAIGGLFLASLSFAAFSLANGSLMQWYALFVVYGLVALAFKTTIWSAGVSSVFTKSRSLALAVVLSGSALGQTLAPLTANWLISGFGWRTAYVGLGLGWGGIALVLVLLFFVDARETAKRTAAVPVTQAALGGLTWKQAARDSRILRIAVANLAMSTVGSGISVHLVPVISDAGIDRATAVEIAATAGLAGFAGKLLVGWLLDRVQGSLVPFLSFAVGALGYFLLLGTLHSTAALTVGAMALGFAAGAGLQVTTYLVTRYAGLRSFGAIYGTISSTMMAGAAMGPVIAGRVYDVTGSYAGLLTAAIPVMLVCSLLFVGLGAYPIFASGNPEPEGDPAPAAA
jgi:predicted MFS family arabinose efflux permease